MAKLNQAEQQILDEINKWKGESPSFLAKTSSFVSKPLSWLGNQIIPTDVQNKSAEIVQNIMERIQIASNWTISDNAILEEIKQYAPHITRIDELKTVGIHDLDSVSLEYLKSNKLAGALQGLGTGLLGWVGLLADLPAFFTIAMRLINQVSLCYGYKREGDNSDFETEFILHVFKVATASNSTEKQRCLSDLKDLETNFYQERDAADDPLVKHLSKKIAVGLSSKLVQEIVLQILQRKAIAMIPGVGALLNSGFNYLYMQDVGKTAFMLYRERFLRDKSGRTKTVSIKID